MKKSNKKEEIMTDEFSKENFSEEDKKKIKEMADDIREASSFDLNPHIINLIIGGNGEPFFGYWLRRVTKVPSFQVPTAGVTVSGGELIMYWNPLFFSKLKPKEIRGVLKHELYHLIFDHVTDRKRDPAKIWNIATDAAINSLIDKEELPEIGIIPGVAVKDKDGKEIDSPLANFIKNAPPLKSSDWYFSEIMKNQELVDYIQQDQNGEGTLDDHDGWDEANEAEREIAKGKIRSMLREAIKEADATNSWGSIASAIREILREIASNQVDWKTLLKQFIGMAKSSKKMTSLKVINKKYPYIHPGPKRSRQAKVRIYIDQSGSVSNEEVEMFFGELRNLARLTEFEVFFFDHTVDLEHNYTWKRNMRCPSLRVRAGGTSFSACVEHFNADYKKGKGGGGNGNNACLILTDGCAERPPKCLAKLAWIILPNNELAFAPLENEIVIKMKKEKE